MIAHIYTSVFQAVSGRGYAGRLERKQIRQEEQEDRKRERQKARGQEESSP
jgi:aspartate-semialdehyde dehydrogenase